MSRAEMESEVERLRSEVERLRKEAHDAPLNIVHQDHKGNRSLGSHSMAWAHSSRRYFEAKAKLERLIAGGPPC
jgi:hypothetical protein